MILNEIREIFYNIKQDKIIGSIACAVAVLSLLIAAFFRLVALKSAA